MSQSNPPLLVSVPGPAMSPQIPSVWTPATGMREHSSHLTPEGAVFFAAPPAEIGELTSAEASLSPSHPPTGTLKRVIIAAALGAIGLVVAIAGLAAGYAVMVIVGLILGALLAWTGWIASRTKIFCSYVGTKGAVRYTYRSKAAPKTELILFADATELRTAATRQYTNGVYNGTSYAFTWTDAAGRTTLKLAGWHRGERGLPNRYDPYLFARAAETAWSEFLLDRAADELARTGALSFNVSKGKSVRVGPGFIEFHWTGEPQRVESADIGQLKLDQGVFTLKHKDATWFSRAGKFSFPYAQMANGRLFLLALDRFIRLTPEQCAFSPET